LNLPVSQIPGVILAAGESSRMGFPKALLPYQGSTFLERLAGLLAPRVSPLIVVLGYDAERISDAVKLAAGTRVLVNSDYRLGQLSSLQTAIRTLRPSRERDRAAAGGPLPHGRGTVYDVAGLLLAPVDHPCVAEETIVALLRVFAAEEPAVAAPTHGGRRGHPVIFSSRLFDELLAAPLAQGARAVIHRHPVREVPVDDAGILADIDNPEIYRRLIGSS
jgi:molybdenum cofactor cytidylyltransferase